MAITITRDFLRKIFDNQSDTFPNELSEKLQSIYSNNIENRKVTIPHEDFLTLSMHLKCEFRQNHNLKSIIKNIKEAKYGQQIKELNKNSSSIYSVSTETSNRIFKNCDLKKIDPETKNYFDGLAKILGNENECKIKIDSHKFLILLKYQFKGNTNLEHLASRHHEHVIKHLAKNDKRQASDQIEPPLPKKSRLEEFSSLD
jgi:hypothetical protein